MNNTTSTSTTTSGANVGEKSGNAITNAFHGMPPLPSPSQLLTSHISR